MEVLAQPAGRCLLSHSRSQASGSGPLDRGGLEPSFRRKGVGSPGKMEAVARTWLVPLASLLWDGIGKQGSGLELVHW